jgi:Flp pilus assembly protein TadD
MALVALGDADAAVPSLQEAVRQGVDDPAVPNALALVLDRRGDARQARDVLVAGLARHPDSMELAHNLARLLALADDPEVRDPATSLGLATAVAQRAGEDPRTLDTLAAAYAVNGRLAEARDVLARAEEAARRQGDRELADAIAARLRSYTKTPGRP